MTIKTLPDLLNNVLQDEQADNAINESDIRDVTESCHPDGYVATDEALTTILGFDDNGNPRRGANEVLWVGMSGFSIIAQAHSSINTAKEIEVDSHVLLEGLSHTPATSTIIAMTKGIYLFTVVPQFVNRGGASDIEMWLEKAVASSPTTFSAVPQSAVQDQIAANKSAIVGLIWPVEMQVGDEVRAMWATSNLALTIDVPVSIVTAAPNAIPALQFLVEKTGDI